MIFINDLPDSCSDFAEIFLLADDAKLFEHVRSAVDSAVLQRNCNGLFQWLNQWLLRLNVDKCKVLSIGLRNNNIIIIFISQLNIK